MKEFQWVDDETQSANEDTDLFADNDFKENVIDNVDEYAENNSEENPDDGVAEYEYDNEYDNVNADDGWDADIVTDKDANADDEDSDSEVSKARMEIYDWLQCIVSAIICGIFIFVFIGRTIGVDGRSMLQTLHNNDRVIMSNLFYSPKKGDIVVFQSPSESFGGTPLVKRVIAVAGQTIDINFNTGDVIVDGIVQIEPYINEITHNRLNFSGPVTVPDGYIFVMGDNRNSSSDSRDSRVGLVDTRNILGRVLLIAIPGADEITPRDWGRIGLVH